MTTSLVHIGDFHAGPGPRNADRYRALDQIIAAADRLEALGAWLWPGDLNHARMTIEDRNALAERLQRMAATAPVFAVYGNHDAPGDLDVFERLATTHPIRVFRQPTTVRISLATGESAILFALPYPTKAGLTASGVAPGDVAGTAEAALDALFMSAAADLEAARGRGELTLMIGHVNVTGSAMSNGQPNIGREISITAAQLQRLGPCYKGLNHIHLAQTLHGAWYAGSVCRLDWGEREEKRWLQIELQRDGLTWEYRVGSRPIDVAPLCHVEGRLTRDGFQFAVPGDAFVTWDGCEVRCRYRFKQSEKSVIDPERVRAAFPFAARLVLEPIAEPDRELRSPAVAAARTLAEKLAAYLQVEQLAPSLAEKLAVLERGEATQVLTHVQNAIVQLEAGEWEAVAV